MVSLVALAWITIDWLQLDPIQPAIAQDEPDIVLDQTSLVRYDEFGKPLWTVYAKAISLDEETRKTVAEQVEVQFWDTSVQTPSAQAVALTVAADQMTFDNLSQDLAFAGDIVAQNELGLRFVTSNARWMNQNQILEGDEDIQVSYPWGDNGTISLQGVGFRYDAQSGKILLSDPTGEHDATLQWQPKSEEQ